MHFAGKTGPLLYIGSCPFSGNSIEEVYKVYKGSKIFPKHSEESGVLLKESLFHPRPNIQKMHCILQVNGKNYVKR